MPQRGKVAHLSQRVLPVVWTLDRPYEDRHLQVSAPNAEAVEPHPREALEEGGSEGIHRLSRGGGVCYHHGDHEGANCHLHLVFTRWKEGQEAAQPDGDRVICTPQEEGKPSVEEVQGEGGGGRGGHPRHDGAAGGVAWGEDHHRPLWLHDVGHVRGEEVAVVAGAIEHQC